MAKEIVKYNNKMNNFPLKNFEKLDMNLFYTICEKVKNHGSDQIEIDFNEIKKMSNYNQNNVRFISDLERMNLKLLLCNGRIETEDEIVRFNLFSTFRIIKSRKVLKISVNEEFAWMLNDIAREFTSFELQEYVSLDGIYAKALYRILKQWKTQGKTPKYDVETLKEILDTPDYDNKHLKDLVIKPAISEINSSGAFKNLTCEVVYAKKRGRPVDGYIFHFDPEDVSGQISFTDNETFDAICQDMSSDEIAATLAVAKNIVKSKEKPKKSKKKADSFNNFDARIIDKRYRELRDKAIMLQSLGMPIPDDLQKEMDALSKERG